MKENDRYQKFSLLHDKSIRLINEQYDDYKTIHGKTATLISLSVFIFPLILTTSNFKELNLNLILLLIIPVLTYLTALIFFSIILFPNELKHGIKFSKIEEHFNENCIDILKKEIVAYKKAFEINKSIIEKQNSRLKISIRLTLFSIGLLCVLLFVGQATNGQKDSGKINIKKVEQFYNYKFNEMSTHDFFSENGNGKDDQSTDNNSNDSVSEESVPEISVDDLETFTKSEDNELEQK